MEQELDHIAEIENHQRVQIPAPEEDHQETVQIHTEIINQIDLFEVFKQYQDIDHDQEDHPAKIHFPKEDRVVSRIKDQTPQHRHPLLLRAVTEIQQLQDHDKRQIVRNHVGQAEEAVARLQDARRKSKQSRQISIVIPQQRLVNQRHYALRVYKEHLAQLQHPGPVPGIIIGIDRIFQPEEHDNAKAENRPDDQCIQQDPPAMGLHDRAPGFLSSQQKKGQQKNCRVKTDNTDAEKIPKYVFHRNNYT